jgi:hypothetical protein
MGEETEGMLAVLGADGPLEEYASQLMLYGRFVGEWDGIVRVHRRDGTMREESCEVYFGWVLEGRAIQDVWIAPARKDRPATGRVSGRDMYGTTLRVYDPREDTWQITWIDPNTGSYARMRGRCEGEDIVQDYRDDEGTLWQWSFTEITKDSFLWIARESTDEGTSWQLRNEFFMKRRVGSSAGITKRTPRLR